MMDGSAARSGWVAALGPLSIDRLIDTTHRHRRFSSPTAAQGATKDEGAEARRGHGRWQEQEEGQWFKRGGWLLGVSCSII